MPEARKAAADRREGATSTVEAAAAAVDTDGTLDVEHLPSRLAWAPARGLSPLEHAEYRTILQCLERHDGNKTHVAEELGIGRNTLYRRMRALGMDG